MTTNSPHYKEASVRRKRKSTPNLQQLLSDFFDKANLFSEVEGTRLPLPFKLYPSTAGDASRVLLLMGDNAAGKSFLLQMLSGFLRHHYERAEALQVSMRYRTTSGMHRAFMYGAFGDGQNSTGATSMVAVRGAFSTAKNRDTPTLVVLDEADLGLSDGYGFAFGELAARNANAGLGKHCVGLTVVSHSREVMAGLVETLDLPPHILYLGEGDFDINHWLYGPLERHSVEDLESLSSRSRDRHCEIERFLASLK